jgi:hypothetical protein
MVLYPMALMGSLLIVRSCGYRLVRRTSAEWIGLLCSAPQLLRQVNPVAIRHDPT